MTTLFTTAVWYGAMALEGVVLLRGSRTGLLSRYPLFYSYLAVVLASDASRLAIQYWKPDFYSDFYWVTQFIALVFGSAVMFEIYRAGLASFPGAARIARNILFLVFALLIARFIALSSPEGFWAWFTKNPVDLERDLRIVQACSLLALVGLFLVYAIPVDRNLKGILVGYGLFVGTGVVQLTLVSRLWSVVQNAWSFAQPLSYLLVLAIWVYALWSCAPARVLTSEPGPAMNYDEVNSATRRRFQKAYTEIVKGVRP